MTAPHTQNVAPFPKPLVRPLMRDAEARAKRDVIKAQLSTALDELKDCEDTLPMDEAQPISEACALLEDVIGGLTNSARVRDLARGE